MTDDQEREAKRVEAEARAKSLALAAAADALHLEIMSRRVVDRLVREIAADIGP